jgi:hypothetical protein
LTGKKYLSDFKNLTGILSYSDTMKASRMALNGETKMRAIHEIGEIRRLFYKPNCINYEIVSKTDNKEMFSVGLVQGFTDRGLASYFETDINVRHFFSISYFV